ncbi:NEAT domain-containing protein [Clostridium sp. NSJ-6]|uniref:NEAT domain-containing protein n=1 Tax=Clostridium hominis TaxID=2763036 RepID=A0ABR7DI33_9CLOT|nr:NEAT domain-containing protein [Clostridium hominis]MBC5630612.1 NEAT domain-containing protein [Clostridium hominis]
MLRKKITGLLAVIMVSTTVLGSPGVVVKASTINNIDGISKASTSVPEVTPEVLANGTYEITNDAFKVGTTDNSGIRDYIDTTSIVTVEDGKITVTLKYTDLELETNTVRTINCITINDKEIAIKRNDEEGISFEIESIDVLNSRITVNLTYYNEFIPEFIAPGGLHTVDMEIVHSGELVKIEENDSVKPETPQVLANGTYKITNDTFKVGTTDNSGIRDCIDTNSIVTVKDDKITVTLKYTDLELETDTVRKINYITINGEEVEVNTNDEKSISFDIGSIDLLYSRITVNLTYYNEFIPEFIAPGGLHTVDMEILHNGELIKVEDGDIDNPIVKPETPDNDNSGNTGSGDVDGSTGATQKPSGGTDSDYDGEAQTDKTYTAKNEITSTSEAGKAMARQALSEDMKIEKIGEKYRAIITFTDFGLAQMNDIIVYVNGKEVESKYIRTASSGLSFELGSLDDSIEISAKISAMSGMRISFGLKVLQETLVEVDNDDEGITDGTTDDTTGGTTEGDTQGGQTSGTSEDTKKEEEPQITVGKLYSIQNNVTHTSETGVAMARKYLNATSKVEEIEGQYYVTLTFAGSDFMQNHVIYVNGSAVTVTRTTNGDETNIRFAVSSLTDDIKVKVYIVPMSREVEFGVELLVDTLTFIKEYTVETLPNTGAATSSAAVAGLGLILTSAGAVLIRKRK